MGNKRQASINRSTAETDISLSLDLDGTGVFKGTTGVGFFDHMLNLFARHGLMDLDVQVNGDLHVDLHHTVEDTGIVLGKALKEALGDKAGIRRYGHCYLPMDEALARVVIDFGGRAFLEYRAPQIVPNIGNFPFQLVEEFLRALAHNADANIHTEILYGRDAHHMAEAIFKGLARAIDDASRIDSRSDRIPSTKEVL
jgi:imidazoleglycerol-phosphate dehydratase